MNVLASMDVILKALEIFFVGWGGIFIVMGVLWLVIKLLLKIFPANNHDKA